MTYARYPMNFDGSLLQSIATALIETTPTSSCVGYYLRFEQSRVTPELVEFVASPPPAGSLLHTVRFTTDGWITSVSLEAHVCGSATYFNEHEGIFPTRYGALRFAQRHWADRRQRAADHETFYRRFADHFKGQLKIAGQPFDLGGDNE